MRFFFAPAFPSFFEKRRTPPPPQAPESRTLRHALSSRELAKQARPEKQDCRVTASRAGAAFAATTDDRRRQTTRPPLPRKRARARAHARAELFLSLVLLLLLHPMENSSLRERPLARRVARPRAAHAPTPARALESRASLAGASPAKTQIRPRKERYHAPLARRQPRVSAVGTGFLILLRRQKASLRPFSSAGRAFSVDARPGASGPLALLGSPCRRSLFLLLKTATWRLSAAHPRDGVFSRARGAQHYYEPAAGGEHQERRGRFFSRMKRQTTLPRPVDILYLIDNRREKFERKGLRRAVRLPLEPRLNLKS